MTDYLCNAYRPRGGDLSRGDLSKRIDPVFTESYPRHEKKNMENSEWFDQRTRLALYTAFPVN